MLFVDFLDYSITSLSKSLSESTTYDIYLDDFKVVSEGAIESLQKLLSVIESKLEKKDEPVEPAPTADKKKGKKKSNEK